MVHSLNPYLLNPCGEGVNGEANLLALRPAAPNSGSLPATARLRPGTGPPITPSLRSAFKCRFIEGGGIQTNSSRMSSNL